MEDKMVVEKIRLKFAQMTNPQGLTVNQTRKVLTAEFLGKPIKLIPTYGREQWPVLGRLPPSSRKYYAHAIWLCLR